MPRNVATTRDALAVAWADGGESYLPFAVVRAACPCPDCAGAAPADPAAARLRDVRPVDAGTVALRWADGHESVLTFRALRALADAQ